MKAVFVLGVISLLLVVCQGIRVNIQNNLEDDEKPAINQDIINYINNAGTTWKAGYNKRLEGLKIKDLKKMCGARVSLQPSLPVKDIQIPDAIPDNFDSRTKWAGCIGPIRDQGHCGSCWAFGAAEALSDRFCIQSNGTKKVTLSTQDLTSCDTSNMGCNGGYPLSAWRYMQTTGIVTEECYPYEMGTCHHPGCSDWPTPHCNKTCKNGATFSADKHFAASAYSVPSNADALATEIMTHGPVEVSMAVYADFANYQSGIYQHKTGSLLGYHAIKAVGWGVSNGTPYWIIANSWNTDWGSQGYFMIRRGFNECGIESGAVAGLAKV